MQLVGATNMYIRMPFICEGLIDGLIGSGIAVLVLAVARATLWPRLLEALPFVQLPPAAFLNSGLLVGELFLAGAAIGVVASWISVGRHLRT
jgi:cell division transport system permease protein